VNEVEYIKGQHAALRMTTSSLGSEILARGQITEAEGLRGLDSFLSDVINTPGVRDDARLIAESMRDNLTFIGAKEYTEAAAGIAASWKESLRSNPEQQLCVVVGKIAEGGKYTGRDGEDQLKSDTYLLDSVLDNFSDEELATYRGRLVLNEEQLTSGPENVKVIVLDDWAISGSQLSGVVNDFVVAHPEHAGSVEVQLVVATEDRIKRGTLQEPDKSGYESPASTVPVRAYYMAHNADPGLGRLDGDAHITGSHCSSDYYFEDHLSYILLELNKARFKARQPGERMRPRSMPLMTNIVRPYRKATHLQNIARFQAVNRAA
jgi:hypothetical protein